MPKEIEKGIENVNKEKKCTKSARKIQNKSRTSRNILALKLKTKWMD